jgi:hypothetical protein
MPSSIDHEIAVIVKAKCDAATATECPGGILWELHKQPPDGSAITEPYGVFLIRPAGAPMVSTGGPDVVKRQVIFRIYGREDLAAAVIGALREGFHKQTLNNPVGGRFLAAIEADGGRAQIEMWARDSEMKWQAEYVCEIWCQFD